MKSKKSNRTKETAKAIEVTKRMESARSLVLHDLAHPPDQVHIAQQLLISISKLQKDFRQFTGSSIRDYWLLARMEKAEYLLTETAKPIRQISKDLGYSGPSSFTDVFKRKHHTSPGEWRRLHKK